MNYFVQFLQDNRRRLNLNAYGLNDRIASVILTPRFRASSHVVVLVMPAGSPEPVLVAKAPRLRDGGMHLQKEAASLHLVQQSVPGGLDTIPRVVAFEEYCGRPILVETALLGRPMDPPQVRRRFAACCDAACDWLAGLHHLRNDQAETTTEWCERLVIGPLQYLSDAITWGRDDRRLLDQTRDLLAPLSEARLPTVLEHGDFSHPNVMLLKDGRVGVVDWEMADPHGVPCHDLIFFLAYAAFARENARENNRYLPAIQAAFFGPHAWARRYIREYAQQLSLEPATLLPLFLLCWVRYMAGLVRRLSDPHNRLSADTAQWLRQNRYYAVWRYSLEHIDQLKWLGAT